MEQKSFNTYTIRDVAWRIGAVGLLGLTLLSGCAGFNKKDGSASTTGPNQGTEMPYTPTQAAGAMLTFNSLCVMPNEGCSNVIQVYPGVSDDPNKPQDKVNDGTYFNGNTAVAVCETKGRTVTSHPSQGESYRQSDEWYLLQNTSGGQPEYASATYADVNGNLPECPSAP